MPMPDTGQRSVASPTSVSSLWSSPTGRQNSNFPAAPQNSPRTPRTSEAGNLVRSVANVARQSNAVDTTVRYIANALDTSDSVTAEELTQQLGTMLVNNTPTPASLALLETIREIVTPHPHTP